MKSNDLPLCVDLDGTYLKTDVLFETLIVVLKKKPWLLFFMIAWLLKGKSFFKTKLECYQNFSTELWPINESVKLYCEKARILGREVVLVTGSHENVAKSFLGSPHPFTAAYGTQIDHNLTGENKAKFLVSKFGEKGFDYIGDSEIDVSVWRAAKGAIAVTDSKKLLKKIDNLILHEPKNQKVLFYIYKALRPHQWSKNLLIFVPFLLAHRFFELELWINALVAFISFSLLASSVYVMNDLFDLDNDRKHSKKKYRPFASGNLSIKYGFFLIVALLFFIIICAYLLSNVAFMTCLFVYILLNIAYSSWLKRIILLDVFILTSFYIIRLFSGGVATGIPLSEWLILFSFFVFLSLAYLKRFSDLLSEFEKSGQIVSSGRGYAMDDTAIIEIFGVLCGYLSVLVFALYVYIGGGNDHYLHREWLWPSIFVLLYWISSMWLRAHKGEIKDDPVKFAITDRISIVCAVSIVLVMWASI